MKSTPLGIRKWLAFILAGLVGQLAWAIENNYLNLYIFAASGDYGFIPVMTALSAVAATLTTLFIGALTDRLGKRKIFVSCGYIIWGISIILFAFLDPKSSVSIVAYSGFVAGTMIVLMDCIMTFFGSTANDAAFNAFVNDQTDETNRGKVDSVLATLPLFAMIAVTLVGGMLGIGNKESLPVHWDIFFYIFGGVTSLIGIICLFLLPQDKAIPKKEEHYLKNIFYGFRPKVVKDNKELYLVLIAFMIFNIAIQCFMPYFMIYIQNVLNITGNNFTITLGIVLVGASLITIVVGAFMDKIGRSKVIFPALGFAFIGGIIMTFVNEQIGVIFGGIILMAGYLCSTAVLSSKTRDYIPEGRDGVFQGVRMVFVVLIPMVTGPYIGQGVSHINGKFYTDPDFGTVSIEPNKYIFLFTSIILLFVLIPLIFLVRKEKQHEATIE